MLGGELTIPLAHDVVKKNKKGKEMKENPVRERKLFLDEKKEFREVFKASELATLMWQQQDISLKRNVYPKNCSMLPRGMKGHIVDEKALESLPMDYQHAFRGSLSIPDTILIHLSGVLFVVPKGAIRILKT